MERRLCIKNFTSAGVSALTYLPVRREIVAGFEGMLYWYMFLSLGCSHSDISSQVGRLFELLIK